MTNALFYSNFRFIEFSHKEYNHVDNSTGISCHFVGYIIEGTAKIVSANTVLELKKGDLFYIPKGLCYNSYWYPSQKEMRFYSFAFQNIPVPHNERFLLQRVKKTPETEKYLNQLIDNMQEGCKAIGLFYLLMSEMLENMQKENPDPKRDIIDKARCYMLRNDNYSIADVAKYCSVSQSGFYAVFKEVTGTTPQEAKNAIRIQKCRDLLTVEGLSVEQVSERMGFSSSSYFTKVFRKYTGATPSQIKKGAKVSLP